MPVHKLVDTPHGHWAPHCWRVRLGREHVTSARNQTLVGICQDVHTVPGGERIIEALATGLPMVTQELADAGLPPARYFDAGIRFTVMLRRSESGEEVPASPGPGSPGGLRPGTNLAQVLDVIRQRPGLTVAEIAATTQLPVARARRAVTELRTRRLVQADATRGGAARYRILPGA